MTKTIEKHSKLMSYILRHKPERFNIDLDKEGYASIDQLVTNTAGDEQALTKNLIEQIVATDSKGRYQISEDGMKVRAVQGHSTNAVDIGHERKTPPARLFHGTCEKVLPSVRKTGIQPMNRHYVHLSDRIQTALEVGKRHGDPVVLVIDCMAMAKAGYKFLLAPNGVWLVDEVKPEFIIEELTQ